MATAGRLVVLVGALLEAEARVEAELPDRGEARVLIEASLCEIFRVSG